MSWSGRANSVDDLAENRTSIPISEILQSMKKICFVTAVPLTLRVFMREHIIRLATRYEVTLVADFNSDPNADDLLPGIQKKSIPIARHIDLLSDLNALASLTILFRNEHFDAVHSVTPKAGLLAMTAARLAGVPHRVHCFTGQVWATQTGFKRLLLKSADFIAAKNSNHLLIDSRSQRQFLEHENVVLHGQADVLGAGSISGVDFEKFRPNELKRKMIRAKLGVPPDGCLFLFLGRLNQDKGVLDLARAFAILSRNQSGAFLAVIGPDEGRIGNDFDRLCGTAISRVYRSDYTETPEEFMAAADVFVLPSYREGFGSVVIEAAACGIPSIASRIYGLTDAVEENVTGLMHPPGNIDALVDCMKAFCVDSALRCAMGTAARVRALSNFSMDQVSAALVAYYAAFLDV